MMYLDIDTWSYTDQINIRQILRVNKAFTFLHDSLWDREEAIYKNDDDHWATIPMPSPYLLYT